MIKPNVELFFNLLFVDLSQLDDLIFKQGQHQLEQELNEFVKGFEVCKLFF